MLKKSNGEIIRILQSSKGKALVIDCVKRTMPKWISKEGLIGFVECTEDELYEETDGNAVDIETLDVKSRKEAYSRYTMIAGILPFVGNERQRSDVITQISNEWNISKQTIRYYLCQYLVYQNVAVLASKKVMLERELTQDEKNMRWALNKFYYTKNRNSLMTAYQFMLQHKYRDDEGKLLEEYPTIHQFRYYFRKTKKEERCFISREGIKSYQRNHRPLLGDGVQEFAPAVGVGMLDATLCDIFLVDDGGNLVGRPILTACVDAFSGLCCGYALTWEGGVYSLQNLMLNIITDKPSWCEKFGIMIRGDEWACNQLPGTFVTDMGREYASYTFEQITELGIRVVNLPPYRPELKGPVEKFFDLIQGIYKKYLKGQGVIESDFQERGAHDYRLDACLTMRDFEKIVLRCILYYNKDRVVENFPYTEAMLEEQVKPHSSAIWNWGKAQLGANLISVKAKEVVFILLPRVQGTFTKSGLRVNRMRYHRKGFKEEYLRGGKVIVAYNPDNVTAVWLVENGKYLEFQLIESRYKDKTLDEVQEQQRKHKELIKDNIQDNLQAQIELAEHIEAIANSTVKYRDINIKNVKSSKQREKRNWHVDYVKEEVNLGKYN